MPTSRRILIVDDWPDSLESLAMLLQVFGHDTCCAADGPTALALVSEFRPDVILLDIGLPRMDGYEVARQLRQTPEGRRALLVAMTGFGREEDVQRALQAGFDRHLLKPCELTELKALLTTPVPDAVA